MGAGEAPRVSGGRCKGEAVLEGMIGDQTSRGGGERRRKGKRPFQRGNCASQAADDRSARPRVRSGLRLPATAEGRAGAGPWWEDLIIRKYRRRLQRKSGERGPPCRRSRRVPLILTQHQKEEVAVAASRLIRRRSK